MFVDDELRDLLVAADERLDGAVAFITGRSVAMVDRLFAPLHSAGRRPLRAGASADAAAARRRSPTSRRTSTAVAEALQEEFRDTEGVYFERKGAVLAIHTRAAPQRSRRGARRRPRRRCRGCRQDIASSPAMPGSSSCRSRR